MSVNKVQLANGETIIDISDSTVTPETLAEGVTAHDASGQKITGKMVPGGGGKTVQTDWNQTDETAPDFLKNKPFDEFLGDTLSWDGSTEGRLVAGDFLCKVSDAVPTIEDFANGATLDLLTITLEYAPGDIVTLMDGLIGQADGFFVVVSIAGISFNGIVFPETGLYMSVELGPSLPKLIIPGYTGFLSIHTIDKKYLGNVFVQYGSFILLTSGGADHTKKFMLWINDRGELQITEKI